MWIKAAEDHVKEAKECDADIRPADSVSQPSAARRYRSRQGSSAVGIASHVQLKAERAALLAKAALTDGQTVFCALVGAHSEAHKLTEAGEDGCTFAIVPVQDGE
ncbi:hypothetical protein CHARACLAT_001124 [Characodon lateralis]|uniref:Uncharacterized protein n=1 Tax=Characodon lateralis TaxID=208331 RepID=A0ABU7CXT5_9TELE|nr:hypothetical protein [Characodon lateralis]